MLRGGERRGRLGTEQRGWGWLEWVLEEGLMQGPRVEGGQDSFPCGGRPRAWWVSLAF